ncbi:MAG: hypothetical protein LIO62_00845 [Clostridiales bacterium]|nr:hypothetical protein [Clostridiales bacterium]
MITVSLNGTWKLKNCTNSSEIDAVVPGSDFGNLIKAGVIKNPLISGDEAEGISVGENDFTWYKSFNLDEDIFKYENIEINCGCLDTLCTCFINDKKAFESENAFIPICKDIKKYLKIGENKIEIYFRSAVKTARRLQKQQPLPKNNNGLDGIAYLRKPACHFGWDWGPCVPYGGILDDIYISAFNKKISNIRIKQSTSKERSVVTVTADNAERIYILTPSNERIDKNGENFIIENPKLWYTRELSQKESQPLYTVVLENSEEHIEKRIGLRNLYLDKSKDEYGENFCFVLNGEKIFAKGANLIPFSAVFEDSDNSTVDYYLDLAVKSNFNILRIWGGGSYASDYLLERCDELGILIWQDFCFACLMYPFYDERFTENVICEVRSNVARTEHHPCLALWCGNNEIEAMFSYLPKNSRLVKSYEQFFYNTLKNEMCAISDVDYIPTSPLGSECFKNNSSDFVGDTHMWNVWHGLKKLDYYTKRYTRFMSEFGLESLPSMKAVKTFASEDEYDITSPSFNRHQKCVGGNRKMMFYLTEMFDFPMDFKDLPYLTGIVQSECVKNATVHFRQNKGRCNGSIFWQFNDVWNCPSWSSVDFEGVPKALQYSAKDFFSPVYISCEKEKDRAMLYLHNDTAYFQELDFTVSVWNINGSKLSEKNYKEQLSPNSFKKYNEIKVSKNTVLQIKADGRETTEFFAPPKSLNLKKAKIECILNSNTLTLKSDVVAYGVCISSDSLPSDNYFTLFPNEEKTVSFDSPPEKFEITCANNIEFKNSKIKNKLFRFFYRLEPLNIGNFFYYTFN